MCFGTPKPQPLPPTPPAAPTMADPAAAAARSDTQARATAEAQGLRSTQLTANLGGQGGGSKKLAG